MTMDLLSRASSNRAAATDISTSYSELWGDSQKPITYLLTYELIPYTTPDGCEQPYRIQQEKVDAIALSIEDIGIMQPIVVRKHGSFYQVLSGHHRLAAAKQCGISSIPCIIAECDDETAYKIVAETNTRTGEYLPTENAKIFSEYLSKRTKSAEEVLDIISKKFSVSKKTIYRYVNILELIPPLQECIDKKYIPLGHYEKILATFTINQQHIIYDYISFYNKKLSAKEIKLVMQLHSLSFHY